MTADTRGCACKLGTLRTTVSLQKLDKQGRIPCLTAPGGANQLIDTLSLGLCLQNCQRTNVSSPSLWSFIPAALENQHRLL
jgi:hypothetical protein